ncbi:MAG: adenine methylase protein [Candidatus Moranbacteria bacterium GW2011_GWC2_37_73]|nr:MAG: adenine methylase protein [Parcubacteria group bacterium GW2011_GWC1_36_108]KKQ00561.1 MAG: adenine methylase protein [Candidatus Moranbacteria bacterium GW2011_GWD1_36_198]KKQ01839.1 MAG: adenine methylase protein [Candidatus Moranbacteria bacterium GW2011_GWD2_36_198]KKQ40447.1 MAG: adenine methylase protein [Candidatus Moranbacteria bacterium GW2011_GWC2_37_73]
MTQKIIQDIAVSLNIHPIHLRVFMSNLKNASAENIISAYKEFKDENPKPFVKWVGGKRQLLKQFRERDLYPPYDFDPKTATYFEPFVGGGAMFFDLLPKKAVLSDMNAELVTTYNVIKNDVEGLIKKLKEHQKKNNKEYFLKVRAQDFKKLSDVDVAARFIYLNRTCFNGMFRVNSSGQFNVPFGDNKNPLICDEENLRKAHDAMKHTKILHQDYGKVLEKAKKGDFVYFDPPYYPVNATSSFTSYTKEGFLEKQQIELKDAFMELHKRGCYVMLSNSDTPLINELYSGLGKKIKIHTVDAGRSINSKGTGRGKIKEVVVINY